MNELMIVKLMKKLSGKIQHVNGQVMMSEETFKVFCSVIAFSDGRSQESLNEDSQSNAIPRKENEVKQRPVVNKKRRPAKDRSNGRYSQSDFMELSLAERLKLANYYMFCPSADFDDGTFRYSRKTFLRLCKGCGIEKRAVYIYAATKEEKEINQRVISVNSD